jgi:thiosulfate/3-mercaptopyruvate sulfurtransferase
LIEIDVSPATYQGGHMPGAQLWKVYADLLQLNYRIIDRHACAEPFVGSEITLETSGVVYGCGASLALWLLRYYGHVRVSFLNGSRRKWRRRSGNKHRDARVVEATYSVAGFEQVQETSASRTSR